MTRLLVVAALALVAAVGPAAPALGQPQPPEVTAAAAVLWDPADDRALVDLDADLALRPASTTKIMTVLLALEEAELDDTVTVSAAAVRVAQAPGAATLNLRVGQQVALSSLLAGLVLRSGNDAAVAVAEHVAGSEEAFVQRMNARAAELGLDDTNFINATGLTDDPAHHSSPLDLARLAEVALRNDDFAAWAAAARLDIPGLGTLDSRNELLGAFEGATGVKTGFTALAGMCLVASAERDGRSLIAVVLDSERSFADAGALLEHGFRAYTRAQPLDRGEVVTRYRWADGEVPVAARRGLGWTYPRAQRARWRVALDPVLQRPLAAGDEVGLAELLVDGEVVRTTALVTTEAEPASAAAAPAAAAGGAVHDALRAFARLRPVARSV